MHQFYEKVPERERTPADPQKEAGIFSHLTFWWMNGIFQTGAKRPLDESDFLPLQEEDETRQMSDTIEELWRCEKKASASNERQPRFWKIVLSALNLQKYVLVLLAGLVDSACRLLQVLAVGFLVLELMFVQDDKRTFLLLYVAAIFLSAVIGSLAVHHYLYHLKLIGMRLKAALKGVVYLKVSGQLMYRTPLQS